MQVFLVRGGKLIGQEYFILEGVYEQSDEVLTSEFLKQFYTARTAGGAGRQDRLARARRARQPGAGAGEAPVASADARPRAEGAARFCASGGAGDDRGVALGGQGPARPHPPAAARRACRVSAARAEERRAKPKGVPGPSGSPGDGSGARAHRSRRRPRAPEPPHRIECYDVSNIQGTQSGGVDGRIRRGSRKEERVPQVQDPVRSWSERFCDDARDAAPPAPLSAPRDRSYGDADSSGSWRRKRSSTRSQTCC